MSAIVFTMKKQMELLRKHGKIYTVRLNNRKEGNVTIYFGKIRVARGKIRKVSDIHSANLEKYVHLSGFNDVRGWLDHIDRMFLLRGWTGERYSNLALYEVTVTWWFLNGWF